MEYYSQCFTVAQQESSHCSRETIQVPNLFDSLISCRYSLETHYANCCGLEAIQFFFVFFVNINFSKSLLAQVREEDELRLNLANGVWSSCILLKVK